MPASLDNDYDMCFQFFIFCTLTEKHSVTVSIRLSFMSSERKKGSRMLSYDRKVRLLACHTVQFMESYYLGNESVKSIKNVSFLLKTYKGTKKQKLSEFYSYEKHGISVDIALTLNRTNSKAS